MDLRNVDRNEVYRYMGLGKSRPDEKLIEITESIIDELCKSASARFCIKDTAVRIEEDSVLFDSFNVHSRSLARHLNGCSEAIIFAATIGSGVDRVIEKYSVISPSKAVAAQAAAAAMIEYFCDEICEKIQNDDNIYLLPRFSPGYGDFSLDYQKTILNLLNAQKRIGLCLTDGNLLTPIKSVTAIIGKTASEKSCHIHKCASCSNISCPFRKV